jgi:hypothetical protein
VGYPRGIAVGRGYLGPRDVTRKGAAGQRDAPRARFSFPRKRGAVTAWQRQVRGLL